MECDDPNPHGRRHRLLRRQHHDDDVRQPADDLQGHGQRRRLHATGDCQSVIYASGDISIDSEKLCAVLNSQGNDCDWNSWDPNKKILIFASNGPTGITVGPSQTSFQGGLYATNTVATGQSAVTEGPLVSGTKTVVLGQQFGGTFPPITIAPFAIQQPPGGFYISPPTRLQLQRLRRGTALKQRRPGCR